MRPRTFRPRARTAAEIEAELREEVEVHIAMWIDYLVLCGVPRAEAEQRARARFGADGVDAALGALYRTARRREDSLRRREWWTMLRQDLTVATRQARRSLGLTTIALLTFALGIGANTAMFSVVRGILLRPLPYRDPARLAAIWPTRTISNGELVYFQGHATSFESVAAFSPGWGTAMTGAGEPRQLDGARVSANFFQTLGVRPLIGRAFKPGESSPGNWNVAILSHALWTTSFGADSDAIGRVVDMDGQPTRIIGVMPADFEAFQPRVDAWLPLQVDPASPFYAGQTALAFGRLSKGVALRAATAELATLAPRIRAQLNYTDDYARGASVVGLHESLVGNVRQSLLVLLGAVGFLVLIAAVNVANLLLAHTAGRRRELSIRRALGATRERLAGQLMAQSVLLAVAGGVIGMICGVAGVGALRAILPTTIPLLSTVRIDVGVVVICSALTVGLGIAFGLAPALLARRVDAQGTLRSGSADASNRSGSATRRTLVVIETALATALVVGAGLMTESLWRLSRVDLGFEPQGVLTLLLQPSSGQLQSNEQTAVYFEEMTRRIAAIPGVERVGAAQHLPLSGFNWTGSLDIERRPIPPTAEHPSVTWRSVVGDYFGAMGIPLLRGRVFTAGDTRAAPPVVVINAAMAKHFWPDRDPIGERIRLGHGTRDDWATIVGVVGDVRFRSPDSPAGDEAYRPNAQQGLGFMRFVVRVAHDPIAIVPQVRATIRSLDTTVPIAQIQALGDLYTAATRTRRTIAFLLLSFAALGLALAAVGIYGVISHAVTQRTRELGVRAALGAAEGRIVVMMLGDGVRMAGVGIVAGGAVAVVATRSLRTLVFGLTTSDPTLYAAVSVALLGVAAAAAYVPARRAAKADPLVALRAE
jgi:predicted permease